MTKKQFENEQLYEVTMHIVRNMKNSGLISEEEYALIDTIFLEKYAPILGTLCSKNS